MTEKRFVDYFDKNHNYIIQDLQNEDEYQIGFINCDEDVFLKLVNKIAEENEELKKQNEFLKKRCNEYWKESGLNNDYFE